MVAKTKDPCVEQRREQVADNVRTYRSFVDRDGTVLPGADTSRLIQQFMGVGSQHPDRIKQVADLMLLCPPELTNGRKKKKVWLDQNGNVTDDANEACDVVDVGMKGDDDSCPTSHIGIDVVDVVKKTNRSASMLKLLGEIPANPVENSVLCVVSTEEVEWTLPPEDHPDWDSLTPIQQCLTDYNFASQLTKDSFFADQLVNGFDEDGCGIPNQMPAVTVPVLEWQDKCSSTKFANCYRLGSFHPTEPGVSEVQKHTFDVTNLTDVDGNPVPPPGPGDTHAIAYIGVASHSCSNANPFPYGNVRLGTDPGLSNCGPNAVTGNGTEGGCPNPNNNHVPLNDVNSAEVEVEINPDGTICLYSVFTFAEGIDPAALVSVIRIRGYIRNC